MKSGVSILQIHILITPIFIGFRSDGKPRFDLLQEDPEGSHTPDKGVTNYTRRIRKIGEIPSQIALLS